jgi:Dipeptidyl aminopeptidases/acylaminoacyl-peptidases
MIMATSVLLGACASDANKQEKTNAPLIGRAEITVPDGVMTPEVLYSLARISDAKLSPDGTKVLYGTTFISIEQNKGNRELFVVNLDGSDRKQITHTPQSEQNAVWVNGGKEIAFLSSESGSSQIWLMNPDGSNRRKVSNFDKSINGFVLSPDEKQVLFFSDIKYGKSTADVHPDLPKATGRVVTDLMYKHWDEWIEAIPHPFLASFDGKMMGKAIDIMEGEPYQAPIKPFGGVEELAWSPDGKLIAYSSKKKTGLEYSVSTNSDIYIYNIETKTTTNLTEGMMGYDTHPSFSPDGKSIAWLSMERDGYESDKNRLFVADLATGKKEYMTNDFDYNVSTFHWRADGQSIYYVSCKEAVTHIWEMGLDRSLRQITSGQYNYIDLDVVGDKMVAIRQSMEYPSEVFAVNIQSGDVNEISFENREIFAQLTVGKSVPRWITTTDNKQMLAWVIYPPNFDPNKKYPALLYCQGGPQSTVSQYWSYRWNMQIMAANGYIVVAPNRRGLPGFGQEWLEQISGDYGGQNMKDYLSAIDDVAKEPYVDETRLGAVGASYGGFSVFWLAGHHNKRFKALIAHAGIFNLEQQYLETEELFFANWDFGGPYWDKSNRVAQKTYATSPHLFVDKWDTPILITHGELDYRILASQSMSAFNAAKLRGVPAELLIYPDENHWIAQPQNGVLFQRVFFDWLDKWLKE